ncbi:MAG: HAD family hydrolase [Clostridiales bacterium]|nr:HAD family hydrolase [Clostridiales bacterium]
MKYNTVIFDLDGTLLNTLEDLNDSVNFSLRAGGFKENRIEQTRRYVGNGVKLLIKRSLPENSDEKTVEKHLALFKEYYERNMQNKTKAYNGIEEELKFLKENGVKLAVVSNKFDLAVKDLCADYFNNLIDIAIGEDEKNGVRKKPAPDSVLKAIETLGSERAKAIYVGDSDVDVQTAHNASIKCIGVLWGFRDRQTLEKAGADFIISEPREIREILM